MDNVDNSLKIIYIMLTFGLLEPGKGEKGLCLFFGLLGCLFVVGGVCLANRTKESQQRAKPSREMSRADEPSRCPSTQGREKSILCLGGGLFFSPPTPALCLYNGALSRVGIVFLR